MTVLLVLRSVFSSTDCLISHTSNRPFFHPEVNIMLLIFSSTDCVFGLLVWWLCHLLFLSWIIVCPLSAYFFPYPLQYWSYLLSIALLTFFPPTAKMVFSSLLSMDSSINVENLRVNTLCFKSAFSWTCNGLERSLTQKIVSNMLWKLAELTDEALDRFWKLKTATEILAAVPSHCPIGHSQCQWCLLGVHSGWCRRLHQVC